MENLKAEKLQWLKLPDENTNWYTNWGDGRADDSSELVAKVNADPALNNGFSDWCLPTKDELKSLIGTPDAPMHGCFWTSSPYVGVSSNAWFVDFSFGVVYDSWREISNHVRLVRASQ